MKMPYTELEKRFDTLTPSWIASTGRLIESFGKSFSFVVPFKGRTVKKASVDSVNGVKTWRTFETKSAVPDFVVMSEDAYAAFSAMEARCRDGQERVNPFKMMGCKTGWYIELLGSYYHSGRYVQGLSREEHEKEVRDAYASAGAQVLLLWEEDVWERWEETCLPKLNAFLSTAAEDLVLPKKEIVVRSSDLATIDVWRSLSDSEYWRGLKEENRTAVVDSLCRLYRGLGFSFPGRAHGFGRF